MQQVIRVTNSSLPQNSALRMIETNNGQWEQFKRDRFSSRWKKKLSEDATSNLCVRKPRSKSWWRRLSNISLQYRSWIKHLGHENLGNEHRLRKLWIVAQVLLIGIEGNVWRTVCEVCILMLGYKGLSQNAHKLSSSQIRYFTSLFLAPSWIDSLWFTHSNHFKFDSEYIHVNITMRLIDWARGVDF